MFSSKLRRKPYKCSGVGLYSRTIYLFLNFLSSFFSKKLDINKKTFFFYDQTDHQTVSELCIDLITMTKTADSR